MHLLLREFSTEQHRLAPFSTRRQKKPTMLATYMHINPCTKTINARTQTHMTNISSCGYNKFGLPQKSKMHTFDDCYCSEIKWERGGGGRRFQLRAYAKELLLLVCAQSRRTRPAYLNFLSSFFIIQSTPGG